MSLFGCAPEPGGRATFPLVSRSPLPSHYVPVATIDEMRCEHMVLFLVGWGEDANHEALVTDVLKQYKGDAITNAELTFFSIPAIVYNQSCARIQGTVVKRSDTGPAGAGTPPPLSVPHPAPEVTP